jgi:hypothetical protein
LDALQSSGPLQYCPSSHSESLPVVQDAPIGAEGIETVTVEAACALKAHSTIAKPSTSPVSFFIVPPSGKLIILYVDLFAAYGSTSNALSQKL